MANAGAIGMIETSSGELDAVRDEIRAMPELATGKPFAVNVAQTVRRAVSGPTSTTSGGVGR